MASLQLQCTVTFANTLGVELIMLCQKKCADSMIIATNLQ